MKPGWRKCELGDVLTLKRGYDLPTKEREEGNVPIVSSSGITGTHKQAKVRGPGVVTGRYGTLGEVFFVKDDFWPLNTALYVQDFKGNDPRFISYFLSTLPLSEQNVAGAVPGLNRNALHKMQVTCPPVTAQRNIVHFLSAYDDLIEDNTQRILVLEEMAQAIYREWFVSYRVPGHEDVEMVESKLGHVPEGWGVRPIGDVLETLGGGTPSTKKEEYWTDGEITWFTPSDLTSADRMFVSRSDRTINDLGLKKSSAKLFPPYSVMMTSRATVGVVSINTTEACTNQGFITTVPNDRISAYQIYFWIKQSLPRILQLASGATFKEINKTDFRSLPIPIPPLEVSRRFKSLVDPMGELIRSLQQQVSLLRETRDLLLPRLVSGEIAIEDLDSTAEEAVT